MTNCAIVVEKLSKQYHIGRSQQRHDTLRDLIVDGIKSPFNRQGKSADSSIWALRDVSFTVNHGDVMGIIGQNGAGKSTLLKLLARITEPTSGRITLHGRVGSLLEVATGFHPELTGRENIYLNGAILGMKKSEINRKFDDIAAFSEIESFLDTPVKRYSSGMYVRLAFAVAAHLEPEILLVDEVLAVGDAGFQKKCLGKMGDVAKGGRTILFVSHNMAAIQHLCSQAILLNEGQITTMGQTSEVVTEYLSIFSSVVKPDNWIDLSFLPRKAGTGEIKFQKVQYSGLDEATGCQPYTNGPLEFMLLVESRTQKKVSSIAVSLSDDYGTRLINADTISLNQPIELKQGLNTIKIRLKSLFLSPGVYSLGFWIANPPAEVYDWIKGGISVEVIDAVQKENGMKVNGTVFCDFDVSLVG